jgi:hypothetical protein
VGGVRVFCRRLYILSLMLIIVLCIYHDYYSCENCTKSFARSDQLKLHIGSNSAFFDTHIKMLWKKYLWGHISTFYQLWILTHTKRLKKKRKIFFFQTWIRINYIFQFWFRSNKVLKSFHLKLRMQNLWIYYSQT